MPTAIPLRKSTFIGWALLLIIVASLTVSADTFRLLQPVESNGLTYSDENITISFKMRPGELGIGYSGISFTITNKSTQAIEVDWDRSSMTLWDDQTSNVMHEATLFSQRGSSTQPTTIPPGGKLSDSVIPTRNVSYYKGWNVEFMNIQTGSQFGLYLTLNGLGTSLSGYNFTFEAVEIEPPFSSNLFLLLALLAGVVLIAIVLLDI